VRGRPRLDVSRRLKLAKAAGYSSTPVIIRVVVFLSGIASVRTLAANLRLRYGLMGAFFLCGPFVGWSAEPASEPSAGSKASAAHEAKSNREPRPSTAPWALPATGLSFIDTSFENASPLWYDFAPDGTINIHLLYDHERSSPNRAAGHFHFLIEAKPGCDLVLELKNLENVWNGQPSSIAKELKSAVISEDGRQWKPIRLETLPENRIQAKVHMPGPRLYMARVEPYRISDLERLFASIRTNPAVKMQLIGKTVEGRDSEIVRIGATNSPYRVFLRARAHPWEAGSSWVIEGLIERLLLRDELSRKYLSRYCVYILPMANKDGVAHGRTRFNSQGKDLNRDWEKPADPELAPENRALEQWLESMIRMGQAPHLALEVHNDGNGQLHLSRSQVPRLGEYLQRMAILEKLLRQDTWFTEGSTAASFKNSGTLGEGWLERYGIDAAVHELNCNWIAGLKDYPSARHWKEYGASLATVFYEYFALLAGK
jgi:zinc carboxypeptidase